MEGLSVADKPDQPDHDLETVVATQALCKRCRSLKLQDVLDNHRKVAKRLSEYVVANLGDLEDLKQSSCPLCQFFASVTLGSQTDQTCDCILDSQFHTFPDINTRKIQLRAVTAGVAYLGQEVSKSVRQDVSAFQEQVILGVGPKIGDRDVGMGTCHHCWYRIGMIAQILPSSSVSVPPSSEKSDKKKKPMALSLETRRVIPDRIPYDVLSGWLDRCKNHHQECRKDVSSTDPPCVKVIDCSTLEIVKTPKGCQFIALSYVWGSTQEHGPGPVLRDSNPPALVMPEKMALVVTDSMEVTRRLGYQYLWIDKYCIDQEDKNEKASQIACMDLIYERSSVVIVAAGGMDSAFGLPGVSTRSRIQQPSITLQGMTLCSTLPNPVYAIRRSGWITRGWTFQEAIFSSRRLYFTEHQVVFECDETIYTEVFKHPWDIEVTQWQHEQSVFTTAQIPGDSPSLQSLVINDKIEEYSARNLTLDSDALNAFVSFFTRMERLESPLYQFYGLPILRRGPGDENDSRGHDDSDRSEEDDEDDDDDEEDEDEEDYSGDDEGDEAQEEDEQPNPTRELAYLNPVNFLVEALCWHHTPAVPDEMAAIRRRSVFPSWTWLGWTGKLSYTKTSGMPLEELDEIDIKVEDNHGRLWPWSTWDEVMKSLALSKDDKLSGRLRVKGWLEQVKIKYIGEMVSHVFYVERQGRWRGGQLYISGGEKYENENEDRVVGYGTGSEMNVLYAKLIDDEVSNWELLSLGPTMMLLKDEGNGQYSRLGLMTLAEGSLDNDDDYDDYGASSSKESRKQNHNRQFYGTHRGEETPQSHRKQVEFWLM